MSASHSPAFDLVRRTRLLAAFFLAIEIIAFVAGFFAYPADQNPQQLYWASGILALALIATAALYALAPTHYVQPCIFAVIVTITFLIAAIDPLSGTLGGGTWVLFQICPCVTALVLRNPIATISIAVVSAATLGITAALQLAGTIPVILVATRSALSFNLGLQIGVMIVLSVVIAVLTLQERRALEQATQARATSEQSLQQLNQLLAHQQQLNEALASNVAELQQREAQLASEQASKQAMRANMVRQAAPVVPILPQVVVIPLVGIFDEQRAGEMHRHLLSEIERQRARLIVVDVTGIETMDLLAGKALISMVQACSLLGAHVIVVGIAPEGAQFLVSLGIDTTKLHTMANLQSAVRYAMATVGGTSAGVRSTQPGGR